MVLCKETTLNTLREMSFHGKLFMNIVFLRFQKFSFSAPTRLPAYHSRQCWGCPWRPQSRQHCRWQSMALGKLRSPWVACWGHSRSATAEQPGHRYTWEDRYTWGSRERLATAVKSEAAIVCELTQTSSHSPKCRMPPLHKKFSCCSSKTSSYQPTIHVYNLWLYYPWEGMPYSSDK